MIRKIEAEQRHHFKMGWLDSYYLFSFANYFDRDNLNFGILRVFNDDTVDAYSGFDEHGHENMEIVTVVHRGTLTHRDSMGNRAEIKSGEVQRMTAGTGVIHAEKNLGDEPVHLYQLWFLPEREGLEPGYEQKDFSYQIEKNALTMVASNQPQGEAMKLSADASLFLSELDAGKGLSHPVPFGRGVFVYVRTGAIKINGLVLKAGDQARIWEESRIDIESIVSSQFVLIEVGKG